MDRQVIRFLLVDCAASFLNLSHKLVSSTLTQLIQYTARMSSTTSSPFWSWNLQRVVCLEEVSPILSRSQVEALWLCDIMFNINNSKQCQHIFLLILTGTLTLDTGETLYETDSHEVTMVMEQPEVALHMNRQIGAGSDTTVSAIVRDPNNLDTPLSVKWTAVQVVQKSSILYISKRENFPHSKLNYCFISAHQVRGWNWSSNTSPGLEEWHTGFPGWSLLYRTS